MYKVRHGGDWSVLPQRRQCSLSSHCVRQLYDAPLKIRKEKFKDLQSLKSVIFRDFHSFYDSLLHTWTWDSTWDAMHAVTLPVNRIRLFHCSNVALLSITSAAFYAFCVCFVFYWSLLVLIFMLWVFIKFGTVLMFWWPSSVLLFFSHCSDFKNQAYELLVL